MADITGFAGSDPLSQGSLLDEHAMKSGPGSGDTPQYTPNEDEKRAIRLAEQLFDQAKKHRAQYDQRWLDYYHYFRGKQWKEQRPSYRHSEVYNLIFRTIQSNVPVQVDARPKFELLPQEPQDYELSEILNEAAEADWVKGNWSEQLLEVVYDSNLYGTGLSGMDVEEVLGAPEIVYKSEDPFFHYPDPDARDVNRESAFHVKAEPMDVRKIKKKYPKVADYIKPDVQDMMGSQKTNTQPVKFRSPIDNKVVLEGSSTLDLVSKTKALLVTVFINPEYLEDDFKEVQQEAIDQETGMPAPPTFVQQANYPNGRKIVICNGVLCSDDDLGYDDGKFPFQRLPNYILPREFWGMSEVEQLEGPQKTFNKLVSFVLDVMTLMGNPIWLIPTSTGIDPENLVNRPGLNVEYDGEKEPRRDPGVQLQPYVMEVIEKVGQWFDTIGGSQDVTRGVQPTGVTAASAISSLQEAAQTRIRQKTRNMDQYLQQVGQQWLSRVFQFRTAPEIFRLTKTDGAQKYFRLYVDSPYQGQDVYPVQGSDGLPHPKAGLPIEGNIYRVNYQPFTTDGKIDPTQAKTWETRGKFDVKVSTGSNLPFAKDQVFNRQMALHNAGVIDNEEVLKLIDYPNYQSVLMRMQQAAATEQQQQPQGKQTQAQS